MEENRLLKTREAADLLAVSERTLWTYTKSGDIPSVRIGNARRYSARALHEWIADQAPAASESQVAQ